MCVFGSSYVHYAHLAKDAGTQHHSPTPPFKTRLLELVATMDSWTPIVGKWTWAHTIVVMKAITTII